MELEIEARIRQWAEQVAELAKHLPVQQAFDSTWSDLTHLLSSKVSHRELADALSSAGISVANAPVSPGYVGATISRTRKRMRPPERPSAKNNDELLDTRQTLGHLANCTSDEVASYVGTLIHEKRDVMSEHIEDKLHELLHGESSILGNDWSYRRLYYSLYLYESLEKQIRTLTRPPLAEYVKIALPKLGTRGSNAWVDTSDGSLYVRRASIKERFIEIGLPTTYRHISPEWLGNVLDGIQQCSVVYDRIVMADPCGDQNLIEVFLQKDWQRKPWGLGFSFEYSVLPENDSGTEAK